MKKIVLVVVIATLFVCAVAPAAFADIYTDGYYTWEQLDSDWDLQLVVPFDFGANGSVYVLADIYTFTAYVVCVEDNPNWEHSVSITGTLDGSSNYVDVKFWLTALVGTKVRYSEFQISIPPSSGDAWLVEVPNTYTEIEIEQNPNNLFNTGDFWLEMEKVNFGLYYGVQPLGGLGSEFLSLTRFPGVDEITILPSGNNFISYSAKQRTFQASLAYLDGQPYHGDLEWNILASEGAQEYFSIDENGLVTITAAPVGSTAIIRWRPKGAGEWFGAFQSNIIITSVEEEIADQLTPSPDQSDKAEEMEDAIGDAADKLENNNSSLGQLTPTRPQINTNLELEQEQLFAVSPLVTNIWSINGVGRMISIVLVVATVAYIFFGKRDG